MKIGEIKSYISQYELNKENFNLGILALVNTSAINFLLPIVILAILLNEKARHLIFSNISTIDPFITTFLIFIFCLLNQKFYFNTKKRVELKNPTPQSFQNLNELLLIPFPMIIWILYLLSVKISVNPFSLVSGIYYIYLLLYFSLSKTRRDKTYLFKTWTLLTTVLLVFLYNIILYESSLFENYTNNNSFNNNPELGLVIYTIRIIALVAVIFIVEKISIFKGKLIYLAILIFILSLRVLITIGSIRPFDVLILYFTILRLSIYYTSRAWNLTFSHTFFPTSLEYASKILSWLLPINRRILRTILGILLLAFTSLFFFNIFRGGNPYDRSQFELVRQNETTSNASNRTIFDTYVKEWLSHRKGNNNPIYLVAGQGGGSRAGCTFLTAMCQLDAEMGDNLLAMTTISGSSNGAGFYLGMKYNDLKIPTTIDSLKYLNLKLYHKDYITHSLFKFLFTDAIASWFPYFKKRKNRNESLIAKENQAFNSILTPTDKYEKNFLDKTWNEVYSKKGLPVFIPVTFNISKAIKAVSSPYKLQGDDLSKFESILDKKNQNLTIGESISLSEMFPIISASASINSDSYMDGGVYDNGPFETLHDIYSIVKANRDSICRNKKIILLSIENGDFAQPRDTFKTEFSTIFASANRSIFSSNPLTHLEHLEESVGYAKDNIIRIKAYDSNSKVVMSRYLKPQDIDTIILKCIKETQLENKDQFTFSLFFDYGEDILTREAKNLISNLKTEINSADSVFIRAYCDLKGKRYYNEQVLIKRGNAVKNVIDKIAKDSNKVKIKENPNAFGKKLNIRDRLKDRRVEIEFYYHK